MSELPPLPLLQTIEAVTRLGSFKRAAEELFVTPSAVSHRVRLVEEQFGKRLFEREGQGVRPTKNAEHLAQAVAAAQADIQAAWRAISTDPDARVVRVSCMAAFAEQFILSDMESFKHRFPDFQLDSTNLTYGEGALGRDHDILISIGPYPNEDWRYEDIFPLSVRPIVSSGHADSAFVDGALFGPLLGTKHGVLSWEAAAASLGRPLHPGARRVTFDSIVSACAAAERGMGVALAPTWIADQMAARGSAVALGDAPLATGHTYWVATRKDRKLSAVHDRFNRWLRAKLA